MSDQTSEDQKKVDEYLDAIQERILVPIQETGVGHYCTATLLLLFAAMDGLGKLSHTGKKDNKPRISEFLDYMGGDYKLHKKQLLKLRNSLVHSVINVESFLSQTEIGSDYHLKKISAADLIWVNTTVMYRDVVGAFERFRTEIKDKPPMMKRAADRLVRKEVPDLLEWRDESALDHRNGPTATPPQPVRLIYMEAEAKIR